MAWPRALMKLRDEIILFFEDGWVAIKQIDGTFEVARLENGT
jgi:hypothetical protein